MNSARTGASPTVMVGPDQPVVTAGPYRLLHHPSYTGVLLACAGIGLASANWVGLAGLALLPLAGGDRLSR